MRAAGGSTGTAEADILAYAPGVIAARLQRMAEGLADPLNADHTEMQLMASEKVEALAASALTTTRYLGEASGDLMRAMAKEASEAATAFEALMVAPDPVRALSLQAGYMMGWWSRAALASLAFTRDLDATHRAALEPFQTALAANAERLR